jgi:hypothetical protein
MGAILALVAAPHAARAQALPVLQPRVPTPEPAPPPEPPPPERDRFDDDASAPAAPQPAIPMPPPAAEITDPEALRGIRDACERAAPDCDPVALLSRLERRAVDRAMTRRGLAFDRAPQGKRIRKVIVVPFNVFGPGDGFLRWFNIFHVTTRDRAVRRELQFEAGDVYDQHEIDESARRLRDPISTGLAAIAPIATENAGEVDVLVVTRDVWSIRLNSNYEVQGQDLTKLSLSFSENNFFGMRKLLAASFRMDQGEISVGPTYIDKNVAGRHLDLRGIGGPVFNRDTREYEGSESAVTLARPLWSLDTRWGAAIEWSHRFAINRVFRGNELDVYDNPDTPEMEMAPREYRQRRLGLALTGVRGFGDAIAQRLRGGWELTSVRPQPLETFPDDPVLRDAFIRDVLPRSERTSVLFVGWEAFEARYRNFQYISTFELAEDTRMGFNVEATAGVSLELLGSTVDFLRLTGAAGYTGPLGADGLWRLSLAATTRLEGEEAIDNIVSSTARVVSPTFFFFRFVTQAQAAGVFRDSQNVEYRLGGDNGLRGFLIGEFAGDRKVLWQTELRSRPIPVLFMRWGFVLFHDLGGAADRAHRLDIHQDIGVGFRSLTPQLASDVFRFDLAYVIDGERDPALGRLRFTAGYEQSF